MGLDMYLLAKINNAKVERTGACGGLFPLAPKSENDLQEIGYWRKAYSVCDFILERLEKCYDDVNLEKLSMGRDDLQALLDECEWREQENCYENDWDKQDWQDTKEIVEKALALNTEQYYFQIWY